jgi:radical SAM superfamily enzyme YgiQ (UPF0313 family)
MKTLLIALNAKYIHSALGIWYLKSSCNNEIGEIKVMEFTINEALDSILASIYMEKADVVAFSCYIWNITQILKIAEDLKKVSSDIKVILGGPEVSYDARDIVSLNPFIDYVLSGEGEFTFKQLLKGIYNGQNSLNTIEGLCYRENGEVIYNDTYTLIEELDSIPSPYSDEILSSLENKIVYFESSRGCPFSCSYCISSTFEGVRYFSMERVKKELERLIKSRVRQIKFVDRTFNCNNKRAKEIFKFIISRACNTNFHFEAAGDLFDSEMLEILSNAPPGLFQFEIGLQSTNNRTLESVNRKTSLEKVFYSVERLRANENLHLHLDLIAGLPYEDYETFKKSFDKVYLLRPHNLQLGFLKMLKGSQIREASELHRYCFREYPPYEVLSNSYISYDKILELKGIEELLERYFNSGRFVKSLYYITQSFDGPFHFYEEFLNFNLSKGYLKKSRPSKELYPILLEFYRSLPGEREWLLFNELLKFDFLRTDRLGSLYDALKRDKSYDLKEKSYEFLKNEAMIDKYLPAFKGIPAKQIFKLVHFEVFDYDLTSDTCCKEYQKDRAVVVFNYSEKDRVTGLYGFKRIDKADFK